MGIHVNCRCGKEYDLDVTVGCSVVTCSQCGEELDVNPDGEAILVLDDSLLVQAPPDLAASSTSGSTLREQLPVTLSECPARHTATTTNETEEPNTSESNSTPAPPDIIEYVPKLGFPVHTLLWQSWKLFQDSVRKFL